MTRGRSWLAALVMGVFADVARACPMCAQALEGDGTGNLPHAFGYSVLFMLAMPFLVVIAFSIYFYALSLKPGSPQPRAIDLDADVQPKPAFPGLFADAAS